MPRGQLDGFAGADKQDAGLAQVREQAFCQTHGGECDRHRIGADAGVGAHTLGHGKGLLQQAFHRRMQSTGAARGLIGILDLAENLRLAEHHRIQPGSHAKQVADGGIIGVPVKELIEPALGQSMVAEQPMLRGGLRTGFDFDVKFGAVAGGKDQRLVHAGLARQVGQCRWRRFRRKRDSFAQFQWRGQMIQSKCDKGHACDNRLSYGSDRQIRANWKLCGAPVTLAS